MIQTLPAFDSDFQETFSLADLDEDFLQLPTAQSSAGELSLQLSALSEFLEISNHPFQDGNLNSAPAHNWASELRILYHSLLKTAHFASRYAAETKFSGENDFQTRENTTDLYLTLSNAAIVCEELTKSKKLDFYVWSSFAGKLRSDLTALPLFQKLTGEKQLSLPSVLEILFTNPKLNEPFGKEVLEVIQRLNCTLEHLKIIGEMLEQDEPLKRYLPILAAVRGEARDLLNYIERRILLFMPPENEFFDPLDGTIYVISMELRKVFSRELVGVTDLRAAIPVRARIETAFGLLQDCFQQSIVVLAQAFEPQLSGEQIFTYFQTRLEQSLLLRNELWEALQAVKKAETSPETYPIEKLHQSLLDFYQNSFRFLMFKDCEETERFVEEVLRARQLPEITHVLHRFGAYLETLLRQINMRTVLANHPFDFPQKDF